MNIDLTKGTGQAPTALSAFDKALYEAGIADANLIYLSSSIPPGSNIRLKKQTYGINEFGSRYYIVKARHDQEEVGKEAWAGIGWSQREDRAGVFVEHHGETKAEVIKLIKDSLNSMLKYRKGDYNKFHIYLSGIKCKKEPVCALVAAVYQIDKWRGRS